MAVLSVLQILRKTETIKRLKKELILSNYGQKNFFFFFFFLIIEYNLDDYQ